MKPTKVSIDCQHCHYSGRPARRHTWLTVLALLVWIVPIAFLSQGYWPFLIFPAMIITIWAWLARTYVCPKCGSTIHNDSRVK